MNDAIVSNGKISEVRLVGVDGEQIGIVSTSVALEKASDLDLDLVIIAEGAKPPVAIIRDQKKFIYEEKLKKQGTRKSHKNSETKEVRFKLKIEENDFNIKINNAIKFLKGGDKLKIQIQFRGREIMYPELGLAMLERVSEKLTEYGTVLQAPNQEGRNVSMVLQPNAKKEQTVSEQRRRGSDTKNARAERQAKRLAAKGLDVFGNKVSVKPAKPAKENLETEEKEATSSKVADSDNKKGTKNAKE
jgi:translation initiation factor IF-3